MFLNLVCFRCFIVFDAIAIVHKMPWRVNFFDTVPLSSLSWEQTKLWAVCQSVCSRPRLHPMMSSPLIPRCKSVMSFKLWEIIWCQIKQSSSQGKSKSPQSVVVVTILLLCTVNFRFSLFVLPVSLSVDLLIIYSINWLAAFLHKVKNVRNTHKITQKLSVICWVRPTVQNHKTLNWQCDEKSNICIWEAWTRESLTFLFEHFKVFAGKTVE